MEAIGAAGAIVGLAGNALAGLKSLGEFIAVLQDGRTDLDTTRQRLVEHEFRLSELRTEYNSMPTAFIIPEEKILLDECIKGSHEEVKRYRKLLEEAAKTRTQRKSFQTVETAVRMYLRGEDFKKHRSILQDRTLRLQEFSERSHRIRTTECFKSVMSSATQHHAEDMAAHTRTADTLHAVSQDLERNLQKSLNTSLAVKAHVTAIMDSYNQETQTLIQSSQLSTVQELNESMKSNILPIIQSLFDDVRSSDRDLSRRNQREARSQHRWRNRFYANESGDGPDIPHAVYRTPLGRLYVSYSRQNTAAESFNAGKFGATYWIKFDPYSVFSKSFVEWRLFLNPGCTGPPTTVWCKPGALCEDIEVIEALGLIPVYYNRSHQIKTTLGCMGHRHTEIIKEWRTKLPDYRKLRRLLDERRVSPSDSIRSTHGTIEKILTVFVRCHKFCEKPQRRLKNQGVAFHGEFCFCEAYQLIVKGHSDFIEPGMTQYIIQKSRNAYEYLSRFYPAYYETLKLLLEVGCEPHDWDDLMSEIACETFHVMVSHTPTDFFRLNSPLKMIRVAARRPFFTGWFRPAAFGFVPILLGGRNQSAVWGLSWRIETHIGNLLPHEHLFNELEETIFDIGGVKALKNGLQYDRWLLVLMSFMQPKLRPLIDLGGRDCGKASPCDFSVETVLKEIANACPQMRSDVAQYVVFHGSLSLLQFMVQNGFDSSTLLRHAGRRGNPEIVDFVLQSCLEQKRWFRYLHFLLSPYIKQRLIQDPVFRTHLLDLLVAEARHCSQQSHDFDGPLFKPIGDAILVSEMAICHLMLAEPAEAPEYVRRVVDGCISRYSEEHLCFLGGVRLYILRGLYIQHRCLPYCREDYTASEDLGRSRSAFHQILQQLLSSSAFGCGIEHIPNDKPYDQDPDIEDYTPLMLALHGGMIPAVEMLVEAGAAIRDCAPCGRSALQLAEYHVQSRHPRVCWTDMGQYSESREPQYISLSADEEMLQILRNALRSRGEEASDPSLPRQDFAKSRRPLVFRVFWRALERIEVLSYWLFCPIVHVSMEDIGERLSYVVVVFTIAFLSIAQLLKLKIDGHLSGGLLRLLSRPMVMIPVAALIIRGLWRHYFVGSEGSEGLPR